MNHFKKKNIVIICFEMLPYSKDWGGMQRVFYYANTLSDVGHSVTVLASKNAPYNNTFNKNNNFRVLHFPNKLRRIGAVESKKQNDNKKIKGLFFKRIKRLLKPVIKQVNPFFFNELSVGAGFYSYFWIKANKASIYNHIKGGEYDDIIISVPPFGLLSVGFVKGLKKMIHGKLIIDYRDPWNCSNNAKGIPFIREKKIIKLSDGIITTNTNHQHKLIEDFGIPESKVSVIMNGFDSVLWDKFEKKYVPSNNSDDKLIISYIGNISFSKISFRNPSNFLNAVVKFEKKDNLLIRFIGISLQEDEHDKLSEKFPNVEFINKVSQEKSFQYMMESSVLLNLHTALDDSSRYLIGGKIFDYYRSNKVILSINSKDSYEFKFITENNLGYCVENDVEKIKTQLNQIYSDWKNKEVPFLESRPRATIEKYSRAVQNKKIISLL